MMIQRIGNGYSRADATMSMVMTHARSDLDVPHCRLTGIMFDAYEMGNASLRLEPILDTTFQMHPEIDTVSIL